ncbi:DUF1120 domain-containing protein [Pseudomonas sp. BIGb0164]|uniref:DUF1120 domain-containing protein n=1 Tax=Pseudomonas sp. BIGb0164 TaxID=2940605 RepID=UPI002169FBE1|nr:DUF1120 domain-containing protein [Pseudomonas sp. BIGb0164]MCS4246931.1 hypothetical protein [Pseudomonas sp. BIGb0164]
MKASTLCRCSTFGLVLNLAPAAFAASNVDLAVRGNITPSACKPSLAQEGLVDYGKIAARDLNRESFTPLPLTQLPAAVNCQAPTLFALRLTDNRAGSSAAEPYGFGLGLINASERLGVFHTTLHTPLAENAPITQLQSSDNGQSWSVVEDNVALPPLRLAAFGDASSGVWSPLPIQALRVQIRVSTLIAPAQGLTLDREVPLDGSATLDLIYL